MTKKEFLNELEKKLKGLPKEEVNERVNFYDEMIDDIMEEGKSEEEAVESIGDFDSIVENVAKDTKMTSLVKEKIKFKRAPSGMEILLLILGFPLWLPLLITALVLILVMCILSWVIVLVAYSVELAFIAASIYSLLGFVFGLIDGLTLYMYLGFFIGMIGVSILFFFACKVLTKLNATINKKILLGIKKGLIKGRN